LALCGTAEAVPFPKPFLDGDWIVPFPELFLNGD
jgi:hypothetical protein